MDLTIIRKDGTQYLLSELGIKTLDFIIDAPKPRHHFQVIDNRDGVIDLGTSYEGRTMKAKLYLMAFDTTDWPLLRNDLFKLFDSREAFYIVDSREPGKRWEVKTDQFTPEQLTDTRGKVEIPFTSTRAYAQSIGTTTDPLTFDAEIWQTGGGLVLDETHYTHTVASFSIYNAGDGVTIDPRFTPLKITYTGPSALLEIKNLTTGDHWTYNGGTQAADKITLEGVRSTKNGLSIFGNTNRKLITLAPGFNDFQLIGTQSGFSIAFEFRFYTL